MKVLGLSLVVFAASLSDHVLAQEADELQFITETYSKCLSRETEVAKQLKDNDERQEFLEEGQAHCDEIMRLKLRTAKAKADMAEVTARLISEAKKDLGLK